MSEPWEHPLEDLEAMRAWIEEKGRGASAATNLLVPIGTLRALLAVTPSTAVDETHFSHPDALKAILRMLTEQSMREATAVRQVLQCAICVQDARNAEAAGLPVPEIHPAAFVGGGNTMCDVRHRIGTPAQARASQASGLLIPQNGHLPPGFGG